MVGLVAMAVDAERRIQVGVTKGVGRGIDPRYPPELGREGMAGAV